MASRPLRTRLSRRALSSLLSPMTNLSSLRSAEPVRIVGGSGCRVTDDRGRSYLEAVAGLWCCSLGWGNEELVEAASQQMRELSYYHAFGGRLNPSAEELAERLIERAPTKLRGGRCFFGMSGSDANDSQVRLVWAYNAAIGKPHRRKFISRHRAYHGVTLASASLTGLSYVHEGSGGLPLDFVSQHLTCPSHYHEGRPGETESDFVARLAAELETAIVAEGPHTVAAFIAEPLQGAGGVIVPPVGYFDAMHAVCARHGVLLIADEVITGFGRLGTFWGSDAIGVCPDLLTCAKVHSILALTPILPICCTPFSLYLTDILFLQQLTSGYLPLSAALIPAGVYEALEAHTEAKQTVLGHGYTYTAHPVACALALKVLEISDRERLVERVAQTLGPAFQMRLRSLGAHALVGEARGVGLIGALELVRHKEKRVPFSASAAVGAKVAAAAMRRGLMVRALAGDVIALCPPLVVSLDDIEEMFETLQAALDEVLPLAGRD